MVVRCKEAGWELYNVGLESREGPCGTYGGGPVLGSVVNDDCEGYLL